MDIWFTHTLNGLSFGMLLFLVAAGLSLIFGLMRVLNLAHGSYYLLGAYVGITVSRETEIFWLGLLAGMASICVLGILMQKLLLDRYMHDEMAQILVTFGFLFIIADVALWIWGGHPQSITKPGLFDGSVVIGSIKYPIYKLFLLCLGAILAVAMGLLQEKTRVGAVVRAGVDDEEMTRGLGINVPLIFTAVFGLGALLAGAAGVLGTANTAVGPAYDFEILIFAFVVVIVGGLGSLRGALVGAIFIGLVDSYAKAVIAEFPGTLSPTLAQVTIYAPMAIVLALRPNGLFGRT